MNSNKEVEAFSPQLAFWSWCFRAAIETLTKAPCSFAFFHRNTSLTVVKELGKLNLMVAVPPHIEGSGWQQGHFLLLLQTQADLAEPRGFFWMDPLLLIHVWCLPIRLECRH